MSADLVTNLLGARVEYLISSGGRDTGTVRAVYTTPRGSVMLLVAEHGGRLVTVSHDSARLVGGDR